MIDNKAEELSQKSCDAMKDKISKIFNRRITYVLSFIIRILLLLYGEWQDAYMEVKFTDVDYFVFSDAAEFVYQLESPYRRATYRYNPVLAWILVPNTFVHKAWGKVLFICFDFCTAALMEKILKTLHCKENIINAAIAVWLFNPITMTISCRGNAESILSALVVAVVYAIVRKNAIATGLLLAVAIHMKIYPIIYSLCIFCIFYKLDMGVLSQKIAWYQILLPFSLFSKEKLRLKFIFSTALTFIVVILLFYLLYGYEYLVQSFLYHISRRDIRHNFSVYFYVMYLNPDKILNFFGFVSQVAILIFVSLSKYEDPPFCFFLLTYTFVTFNKVCTSQYFIWYLSLLPLLVPGFSHLPLKKIFIPIAAWLSGQAVWLYVAYLLEFQGKNVFFFLWLTSILFFIINIWVIKWCINNYKFHNYFSSKGTVQLYQHQAKSA